MSSREIADRYAMPKGRPRGVAVFGAVLPSSTLLDADSWERFLEHAADLRRPLPGMAHSKITRGAFRVLPAEWQRRWLLRRWLHLRV